MNDHRDPGSVKAGDEKVQLPYDTWLKEKVATSLANTRPNLTHSEVECRMAKRLHQLRAGVKRHPKRTDAEP